MVFILLYLFISLFFLRFLETHSPKTHRPKRESEICMYNS